MSEQNAPPETESPESETTPYPKTGEEKPEPKKEKKKMPQLLFCLPVCFLLFAVSAVAVYLYLDKRSDYNKLSSDNSSLQTELDKYSNYTETIEGYETEITTLEEENDKLEEDKKELTDKNADLKEDKKDLNAEVDTYEQKQAKISAYNVFLKYVVDVVNTHGGFINLTDAEYQLARQKAQATGDNDLVSAVDTAWNNTELDQVLRFMNILDAVVSGINKNI
ncbi:MAG: hypothetical protein ABIE03_00855 [Patescibacteria group bacterium]|nr:hypothetical protein [Patescibacteria group bacterium]